MDIDRATIKDVFRRDDGLHEVLFNDVREPFVGGLCMSANIYPIEQADVIELWIERCRPSEIWKGEFDPEAKRSLVGNYRRLVKDVYDDMMSIIEARLRDGDTLEEIAVRAAMTNHELANFVSANSQPALRTISKLADACGSGLEVSFRSVDRRENKDTV